VRPEVWGQELELTREFKAVAATAQSCGATLFMVDASDRHRESGTADYSPPNVTSIVAGELGGSLWTPGVDLHALQDVAAGAQYIALSTGGSVFTNTRNAEFLTESLNDQLGSYYSIGYRPPEAPDGRHHSVDVHVVGKGLRVRHHENVVNRTAPQRLADIAFSRLRLDVGSNLLELEVTLDEPEPLDGKRYVQPIRIDMPVRKLVLLPDGDRRIGQILVAFAVLDENSNTAPPQLLRLRLDIAADQYAEDAMATQRVRLMVRTGTQRIAVGVRDEVSGVESSLAISLPPEWL